MTIYKIPWTVHNFTVMSYLWANAISFRNMATELGIFRLFNKSIIIYNSKLK